MVGMLEERKVEAAGKASWKLNFYVLLQRKEATHDHVCSATARTIRDVTIQQVSCLLKIPGIGERGTCIL
jgi:hypothetical protein